MLYFFYYLGLYCCFVLDLFHTSTSFCKKMCVFYTVLFYSVLSSSNFVSSLTGYALCSFLSFCTFDCHFLSSRSVCFTTLCTHEMFYRYFSIYIFFLQQNSSCCFFFFCVFGYLFYCRCYCCSFLLCFFLLFCLLFFDSVLFAVNKYACG